jgi:hypothetical protein
MGNPMKTTRWLLPLLLFLPLFSLPAMEGRVDAVFPDQAKISWNSVQGAKYYDIYLGDEGISRLPQTARSAFVGSNEEPLASHASYRVTVAARDAENRTLDYLLLPFATSGWEGVYRWENPTDEDNDGKCRSMGLLVDDRDGNWRIYGDFGDEGTLLLFPLMEVADDWPEVDYLDDSPAAKAYRLNARMFNTTSYEPKSWKLERMESTASSVTTVIETRVWAMRFTTESTFRFRVSETGEKQVVLHNGGQKIASWGMFRCPEKGSGGDFVFACVGPLP